MTNTVILKLFVFLLRHASFDKPHLTNLQLPTVRMPPAHQIRRNSNREDLKALRLHSRKAHELMSQGTTHHRHVPPLPAVFFEHRKRERTNSDSYRSVNENSLTFSHSSLLSQHPRSMSYNVESLNNEGRELHHFPTNPVTPVRQIDDAKLLSQSPIDGQSSFGTPTVDDNLISDNLINGNDRCSHPS